MKGGFPYLTFLAIGVAALAAIPITFTLYNALTVDAELWRRLYDTRLRVILPNTIMLLFSVGILTIIIGVTTAWFITRYDFKGKRILEWALILPFAMPGYVLAYAYASIMAPGGIFQAFWTDLFGMKISPPSIYSFWGVSLILSLVHYPYVYLLTRASLLSQNVTYDEAAQVLGVSKYKRLWSINIRMAYPGIIAGVALAMMEVMADFGTVAMLRYPTFTEAIFRQMIGRFDPAGAAALAAVLVFMTFLLLNLERYFRRRRQFEQTKDKFRTHTPRRASPVLTITFITIISLILVIAFFAPVSLLLKWSIDFVLKEGIDKRFLGFTFNTLSVSAIGATLAVVLAIPAAYLHARRPVVLNKIIYYLSTLGYSLPGPVIAVGLLLFASLVFPWLLGGIPILLMAYIVRFIPITIQSEDSSISMVSRSLEDAARTLGAGIWERLRKILLPLIKTGLFTGWVLVFVDCMKELPATMMLRPLAFDTLAVRVWMEAAEAYWEAAALPALLIVAAGIIPIVFIARVFIASKMGREGNY
ncbi:MAG TPA: iron ABC transporter permease [Nitrospiraceae bacterium]|nr:iron ABC transporter permease [Nitrospiraceae bacterium]